MENLLPLLPPPFNFFILLILGLPLVPEFAFFLILGLVAGVAIFIRGLRSLLLKRMIQNIPTTSIRSAAMGLVEVYGEVVPIRSFKSPISGENCVYLKLDIEEPRGTGLVDELIEKLFDMIFGKSGKLHSIVQSELFFIKDKTGRVMVDANGANIDMEYAHILESAWNPLPKRMIDFLKSHRIVYKNRFTGAQMSRVYKEYLIRPKDKIYIMGTAKTNPQFGYSPKHTENIIIRKGENDRIFYISNKSEKRTLSRIGWKTLTGIFGGMALIVFCLCWILLPVMLI